MLRALARHRRAGRRRRDPPRSPATTRCWRTQAPTPPATPPSIPASRAARAASRRASMVAATRRRLRLPRSRPGAFDLTDRGVKGRARRAPSTPSSIPSAASIAPARRCTLTALLRDAKGAAMPGLPLTLVVEAPGRRRVPRAPRSRTRASAAAPSRSRSCPAPCTAPGASPPTPTRRRPPSARRASSSRTTCPSGSR